MKDNEVYFIKKNHSYVSKKGPYRSVSSIMKHIAAPFNEMENLLRSAIRAHDESIYIEAKEIFDWDDPKIFKWMFDKAVEKGIQEEVNIEANELKRLWAKNSESGTALHDGFEAFDIEQGFVEYQNIRYKVIPRYEIEGYENSSETLTKALKKYRENIFIPEALVHVECIDKETGKPFYIAGQIDKLYLIYLGGGKWLAIIGDYKTDKSLSWKGIYSRSKNESGFMKGFPNMKGPFKEYNDSKLNYYLIKMNYYAKFLIKTYDIKTKSMFITNFPRENKKNFHYPIPIHRMIYK